MADRSEIRIRPYEARDRGAVRAIAIATAYGGEGDGLLDPELFADLMTRYATDFAPEGAWVAEWAAPPGTVVGYLAGGFAERPVRRAMWRIAPAAVAAAIGRGLLCRRPLWRLLAALPRLLAAGGRRGEADLAAYPAHLHVNLLPEARRRAVGRRLVESFLAEAARRGLPGVRATVLADNAGGRRFFERLGFRPLARLPALRPPAIRGMLDTKIVYGKKL